MRGSAGLWTLGLSVLPLLAAAAEPAVTITVAPDPVHLVRRGGTQRLDFDFIVANGGDSALAVAAVRMTAFDSRGRLVTRREIGRLGMRPGVATLPSPVIPAGTTAVEFNPFHELPGELELAELRYEVEFEAGEGVAPVRRAFTVRPVERAPRTRLLLPVAGPLWVFDGHEFYSHHRRLDLANPMVVELGVKHNITRYGIDFMRLDDSGSTHRGAGARLEDYYIFGAPVLAPAAGTVAVAIDGRPDSPVGEWLVDYDSLRRTHDLRLLGGNTLVIDHGNGEFSVFNHLRNGSLKVHPGERVAAGQPVAEVGSSGDSSEPHLHYQLNPSAAPDCDGLPAVFHDFRRLLGSRTLDVPSGDVDSGDIVQRR